VEAIQSGLAVDDLLTVKGAERYSDRVLYALWTVFSVIMIVVAVHDYYRGGGARLWKPLLWEGSSMSFATLLLALQRTIGRRSYDRWLGEPSKWFGHHLKWFPLCLLGFLVVVYGARNGVYRLLGETYDHDAWVVLVPYEAVKLLLFFGLWLGVIFGFDSFARWHAQQRHLLELQRALAESRLATLSSQLRPHFFFNSLNTISALMHMDVERADRLLACLGELLRTSLQSGGQELVPLGEELRLLELYAQIMLERFADRVTVEWRVDDAVLRIGVPAMLMQPLLENAFKHAVERGREKVRIEIAAVRENDELVLSVRNTGSSLPADWREGVGLRNSRERLQVIYGAAALTRLGESAAGVEAVVTLPCREPSA
jgi:two-component system, LytTR family, sensor kinase